MNNQNFSYKLDTSSTAQPCGYKNFLHIYKEKKIRRKQNLFSVVKFNQQTSHALQYAKTYAVWIMEVLRDTRRLLSRKNGYVVNSRFFQKTYRSKSTKRINFLWYELDFVCNPHYLINSSKNVRDSINFSLTKKPSSFFRRCAASAVQVVSIVTLWQLLKHVIMWYTSQTAR